MTGINHVLTGSAIAIAVKQPLLAAPLAFASHFLLDVTPHFGGTPAYHYGHKKFPYIMFADGLLCIIATVLLCSLAPMSAQLILLCILCAILPDILLLHYYAHGSYHHAFHKWHLGIQWFERPPGALVEAAYFIFISTVLYALIWRG